MKKMNFKGKKVLFVTTKNLDYLRNTQEIRLIREEAAKVTVLGSEKKSYIRRLLSVYTRLLFLSVKSFDEIFIGFAPQLVIPLFGWKFCGKMVRIDFFISVYDTLVCDRKKVRENSCLARLCRWADQKTLERADAVISDTRADADYFSGEFHVDRSKIETLYLEADNTIYYPREQIRKRDAYTVLYFGSILPLQGIEVLMKALEGFQNDERFYFYIIGPVGKNIKKTEAKNIEYVEWVEQKRLAKYIAGADLCLAGHFSKDIEKARRTIPGKAYIYRNMKKPMILGDNPANRELYSEDMEGIYFVEMGNAMALQGKIEEVYTTLFKGAGTGSNQILQN